MPELPKPFVCRDQALLAPTINRDWEGRPPCHEVEDMEQSRGNFDVTLIAGLVESDQDLVGRALP
jgi:hypothetical protein